VAPTDGAGNRDKRPPLLAALPQTLVPRLGANLQGKKQKMTRVPEKLIWDHAGAWDIEPELGDVIQLELGAVIAPRLSDETGSAEPGGSDGGPPLERVLAIAG
jgi:hypothetical protein